MQLGGRRFEWDFQCAASKLAEGARAQRTYRLARVEWWKQARDRIIEEIKHSGVEIQESLAVQNDSFTPRNRHMTQVTVRSDLQAKLSECHSKINLHQEAADEYDAWALVLDDNPNIVLSLKYGDWAYFFGKHGVTAED